MAAVRRRVEDDVGRAALDAAFERRLQRLVGRVVMVEGQVVAEQDEAERGASSGSSSAAAACRCPRDGSRPASAALRRPRAALIAACTALTSDDLPMPRAPQSSTLLAGRPAAKRSVLSTRMSRTRSTPRIRPMSTRLTRVHRLEHAASRPTRRNSRRRRGRSPAALAERGAIRPRSGGRACPTRAPIDVVRHVLVPRCRFRAQRYANLPSAQGPRCGVSSFAACDWRDIGPAPVEEAAEEGAKIAVSAPYRAVAKAALPTIFRPTLAGPSGALVVLISGVSACS